MAPRFRGCLLFAARDKSEPACEQGHGGSRRFSDQNGPRVPGIEGCGPSRFQPTAEPDYADRRYTAHTPLYPVERSRFFCRPRQPAYLGRQENRPVCRAEPRQEAVGAGKEKRGKERSDEEIFDTGSKQPPPEYAHPAVKSPVPNPQPLMPLHSTPPENHTA